MVLFTRSVSSPENLHHLKNEAIAPCSLMFAPPNSPRGAWFFSSLSHNISLAAASFLLTADVILLFWFCLHSVLIRFEHAYKQTTATKINSQDSLYLCSVPSRHLRNRL